VVLECRDVTDTPLHRIVQSRSWVTVAVSDGTSFYSMIAQHGADALVLGLCIESGEQIGMLRLARRILPGVPLFIVASGSSPIIEAQIRGLNVTWYGVVPVKAAELKEAIHSAVTEKRGGTCAEAEPRPGKASSAAMRAKGEGDRS
jgi:DNA-binding response OmpR family regulator